MKKQRFCKGFGGRISLFKLILRMIRILLLMNEHTKRGILWAAVVASVIPIFLIISPPAAFTLKAVALYASSITGYAGIVLLLWMFLLGAKSVTGYVFKDLAPVLSIHKRLGKYGSIAILLHPIFVIYAFSEPIFYSVIPQIGTQYENHVTLGRIAFMLVAVIWIVSILLRKKIGFRPWKYIHYFAYISIPFALLHVPDLGTQFIAHPIVKAYYLLLAGTFSLFFLIRLSAWFNFDRRRYEIVDHQQLTDTDYAITLRPLDLPLMPARGQYVYIKQGIISEDHPFSATYCDPKNGDLTIVYRTYGAFTKFLTSLPLGDIVHVAGPYGLFTQDQPSDQKVVYIAGGVGVTPFAQHILDGEMTTNQWLFVSNKTRQGAPLVPQLRNALGKRLIEFYTDDVEQTDGSVIGRIEVNAMKERLGDLTQCSFYICGPPRMVKDMKRSLLEASVPPLQVNIEKFGW